RAPEPATGDVEVVPASQVPAPQIPAERPPVSRGKNWKWLVLSVVLAVIGLALLIPAYWYPKSSPPAGTARNRSTAPSRSLFLTAVDRDGQLHVEWDRSSAVIQNAKTATLSITDGDLTQKIVLNSDELRNGSVTYGRSTPTVGLRMTVQSPGAEPVEEFIRFVGRPVPSATQRPLETRSEERRV